MSKKLLDMATSHAHISSGEQREEKHPIRVDAACYECQKIYVLRTDNPELWGTAFIIFFVCPACRQKPGKHDLFTHIYSWAND